jgi:phospholipid/cholesterol/gamma-HCH transport system ATP-binding protein
MESAVTVKPVDLRIEGLSKRYGTQEVLRGVSLAVEPGEIFVLMGPSGSGKSVLLRHVIGLETADAGRVMIAGKDAGAEATHAELRTALVFQAGALLNSLSVYDNLALYPREHRLYPEAEIRAKVNRVMEALSIAGTEEKIPAELSGGMKKRVAVARAILMEPQLILYDEPTSELDPILAATTAELIATVARETGATSLVVTHDRDLALSVADHVALLMDGELVFRGTPRQLKDSEEAGVKEFMNPIINPEQPRFRKQETAQ